jgi:hypothetical protein
MSTRREFLQTTVKTGIGAAMAPLVGSVLNCAREAEAQGGSSKGCREFEQAAYPALPIEKPYDFREVMVKEFNRSWRVLGAKAEPNEIEIATQGWSLIYPADCGPVLKQSVEEFRSHLSTSMQVQLAPAEKSSLRGWMKEQHAVIVGVRDQMPGCGQTLQGPKDYQIIVSSEHIAVCGYDERGAMFGLYNLESQMELRGGPFLQRDLNTVRHSLYQARMTMSGLGWMDWPDWYLRMLPRYGFDAIYASVYANPNGVRAPDPYGSTMRAQDPAKMHDLIERAARYGLEVYAPIMYRIQGDASDELQLRKLVRDNATEFPEIRGYILLIEGFTYGSWPVWSRSRDDMHNWIKQWTRGVAIATDEFHKVNPKIEVLPWDYNIDFRRQAVDLKTFVIDQYPSDAIPLVTWENGKSYTMDGEEGYLKDYSISEVGPSEVASAQIQEARKRGLKVYAKADTFASWQFGTSPYLPMPYQWYARYQGLEKAKIEGTLETWSYGFKPNFIAGIRAWYSWTDAPPLDVLLRKVARQKFGPGSEEAVLNAWRHFSNAVHMLPDTAPNMVTDSIGAPLFFEQPEPRTMTLDHSWYSQAAWEQESSVSPYWPYAPSRVILVPDFSNQVNVAERYARPLTLSVFNKYLLLAADEMEKGLLSYRSAALAAPAQLRQNAYREVLIAEQIQRMLRSEEAILEFEDLRYRIHHTGDRDEQKQMLDRMTEILQEEITRTQSSFETARRDSRLGYELEQDYFYTPGVLQEKLAQLHEVLEQELPAYRQRNALPRR